MFRLGLPKVSGGGDLGHHLPRPKAGSLDIGDRVLRNPSLLIGRIENGRAVAQSAIIALTIQGGWIVNLEEELEKFSIADPLGVEDDFDRFSVRALANPARPRNSRRQELRVHWMT